MVALLVRIQYETEFQLNALTNQAARNESEC